MAKLPALAELIFMALKTAAFLVFCWAAYKIRLHAIEEYGRVIHEFDPWFNFRATEVKHHTGRFLPPKILPLHAPSEISILSAVLDMILSCSILRSMAGRNSSTGLTTEVGTRWVGLWAPQSTQECRLPQLFSGRYLLERFVASTCPSIFSKHV
jgi:hypothetical protein